MIWKFVLVALLLAAVNGLPGQVMSLNDRQESEAGRKLAAHLESQIPMVDNARLGEFLTKVGLRLARDCGRPGLRYSFKAVQSDDVESFSLPGGHVYVTLGFLALTQSEAEVAGILAHEIGHVAARQHASKIRKNQLANLGLGFLGPMLGGGMRAAATVKGGRSGIGSIMMRFSREDEWEADRMAAKNLHATGYDPDQLLALLRRLNSIEEDKPGTMKTYFGQHERDRERLDNIQDILDSLPERKQAWLKGEDFAPVQPVIQQLLAVTPKSAEAAAEYDEEVDTPSRASLEREIAAIYAPLFYQGIGNQPRFDYITNFDFDGDLKGDNNWENAAKKEFPLRAWIYYSVRETATHYFLHYAAFHPRDYKGGSGAGRIFGKAIQIASKPSRSVDPTGRAIEMALAHENDLEGCLIVVEKQGPRPRQGKVVFVETLAHNSFLKYAPEATPVEGKEVFRQQGHRVKIFVEPRGHGIEAYDPAVKHQNVKVRLYTFTGNPEEPSDDQDEPVGYNLTPIDRTLWLEAQRGLTPMYADTEDYGQVLLSFVEEDKVVERPVNIGRVGMAFRGKVGGKNLARPPWGWFDGKDRDLLMGQWFFDPARVIRRDFGLGEKFIVAYLHPWPAAPE